MSGIFGMPPAVADGKPGEKLGTVEPQTTLVTLVKCQLTVESHQISRMLIKTSPWYEDIHLIAH